MTFTPLLRFLSLSLLRSLSISPSLISITIQMLTFKATSHADWLTGWLADKVGDEKTDEELRMIEKDGEESSLLTKKIGKPSSPLRYLPTPFVPPVNEFTHEPRRESDFSRSQESWTIPSSFCVFVHSFTSAHTHFYVYCLPVHPFCSCLSLSLCGLQYNLVPEVSI